jgi:hypothetical protein
VIRSALVSQAAVREYQVRQTDRGVDVARVADTDFDQTALAARLEHALCQTGLAEPQVSINTVPAISCHPDTGKVKRFINYVRDLLPESMTGWWRAGDDRFEWLTGRRPFCEAVFAAQAQSTPGLEIRRGVAVAGLRWLAWSLAPQIGRRCRT